MRTVIVVLLLATVAAALPAPTPHSSVAAPATSVQKRWWWDWDWDWNWPWDHWLDNTEPGRDGGDEPGDEPSSSGFITSFEPSTSSSVSTGSTSLAASSYTSSDPIKSASSSSTPPPSSSVSPTMTAAFSTSTASTTVSSTSTTTAPSNTTSTALVGPMATPTPEKWDWKGNTPNLGVNLGNWLVPEGWMGMPDGVEWAGDYWNQCKGRTANCTAEFENVWDTYIVEDDVKWLSETGVNMARIPFGYWAFIPTINDEPYPTSPKQKQNLERVVKLLAQYKIHSVLDIHGLPGSQNGWEHSGTGNNVPGFLLYPEKYLQRGLDTVQAVADFVTGLPDDVRPYIAGIQNGNEMRPANPNGTVVLQMRQNMFDFAVKSYPIVEAAGTTLIFSDGYLGIGGWKDYFTNGEDVVLDYHRYWAFLKENVTDDSIANDLAGLVPTVVNSHIPYWAGEWSAARPYGQDNASIKKTYQMQQALWLGVGAGSAIWSYKGDQAAEWNFRKLVEEGIVDPKNALDVSSVPQKLLDAVVKNFPNCRLSVCANATSSTTAT